MVNGQDHSVTATCILAVLVADLQEHVNKIYHVLPAKEGITDSGMSSNHICPCY